MNELTVVQSKGEIVAQQTVGAELFNRFLAYLDATPKTIETYTRALRQLLTTSLLTALDSPRERI